MSLFDKKNQKEKNPQKDSSNTNPELNELEARARAEGAAPEEAPEQIESAPPSIPVNKDMLGLFWKTMFGILARNKGDHWMLTEQEAAQLGELSVPIAEKWLPAVMNKYGAEAMLLTSVTMMVIPRIMKGRNEKDSRSDGHHREEGFGKVNTGFPATTEQHV